MPDGDIIHPSLKRRFQNVYGQICEGHWGSAQLGYRTLHPLKGQIKEYGNAPIVMGQQIVPILESAVSAIENGEHISFAELNNQIDVLGKDPNMNYQPRGRDLMQKAAKKLLVRIDHGEQLTDIEQALYKTYSNTIYVGDRSQCSRK